MQLARLLVLAFWPLSGCSQQEGALTQVIVVVDADETVAANLTRATIEIYDPAAAKDDGHAQPVSGPLSARKSSSGKVQFPFSVGVVQAKADSFLIVVTGYEDDRPVIEQKARADFAKGQTVGFGMYLASPCHEELCAGLASSAWLRSTCEAGSGCGKVETRETTPVIPGSEFDAGLVPVRDAGPMDAGADAGRNGDVPDADAGADAGADTDAEAEIEVTDFALGQAGKPCAQSENQTLACEGHASRKVLKCNRGTWELLETCPESARCDSRVGAGQGTCLSMSAPCLGKAAGEVCDGTARKVCGPDLVSLRERACQANAHCEEPSGVATCVCDRGYDANGQGACVDHNDCPTGACAGGRCVDGLSDYSCSCNSGFLLSMDKKTCNAAKYCQQDACQPGGTCVDISEWSCHCAAGYAGEGTKACSNINDCPTNRCAAPNGTCQDGVNTYTCNCNPGFSGPDCQTDACSPNPCQHGGICTRTAQGASCACGASGYGGARCETDVNECATTNLCTSVVYPCVQTAPPGYTCQGQFADWHMPDALAGSKFAPSYDTSTSGLVRDNVTGLTWQRNLPATYTGCTGQFASDQGQVGDACSWSEAKSYCDGLTLAGQSDWRLPTKIELESILDETRFNPAIDSGAFPGTPAAWFWTASPQFASSGSAWYVGFTYGYSANFVTSEAGRVRCVR